MKKHLWRLAPLIALAGTMLIAAVNEAAPARSPLDSLTLEQALEIAERQHPQLAEAHALVEAAAGRAQQAGALPNPELIVGAQQLPLDRGASNQREYSAGIAQSIPLGGRLGKARTAELLEREVRVRGLEVARRDLRRRVHSAFATALYQEQAFQAQSQMTQSVGKLAAATQARLEAGDATPEELARAEMELARVKVDIQRAESLRGQSLLALAAAMGDTRWPVASLAGNLDTAFEIPTLESLTANLSASPELLQADATVRAREARVVLADSERIPDVKVEALYHRLDGARENTFDIGLSIPLPLFNRHQGRVREARADVAAAEARARLTQNELNLRLREAHAQLAAALANARAYQNEILPRAETVLKSAEARQAAGDTSLADVLPIRRDWAAIRLSHLESLRDVMLAWAELREFAVTR